MSAKPTDEEIMAAFGRKRLTNDSRQECFDELMLRIYPKERDSILEMRERLRLFGESLVDDMIKFKKTSEFRTLMKYGHIRTIHSIEFGRYDMRFDVLEAFGREIVLGDGKVAKRDEEAHYHPFCLLYHKSGEKWALTRNMYHSASAHSGAYLRRGRSEHNYGVYVLGTSPLGITTPSTEGEFDNSKCVAVKSEEEIYGPSMDLHLPTKIFSTSKPGKYSGRETFWFWHNIMSAKTRRAYIKYIKGTHEAAEQEFQTCKSIFNALEQCKKFEHVVEIFPDLLPLGKVIFGDIEAEKKKGENPIAVLNDDNKKMICEAQAAAGMSIGTFCKAA